MKYSKYESTRARLLKGRRVKTLVDIVTINLKIPAGTIMTITAKWYGLSLEGPKCEHCGVIPMVTRVRPEQVELLDE